MNEFNPADPWYEIIEQQADNNSSYGTVKYKARLDSKDVICPNEPPQGPIHRLTMGNTEALPPRYDIVNGRPAEVSLIVRKWWCRKCRSGFKDPRCPYQGKKKTSDAFDDYIAQCFLSDISVTEDDLAQGFNLPRTRISDALKNYLGRITSITFAPLQCSRIWLVPVQIAKRKRLIVFGDPTERQRNILGDMLEKNQLVILGIAKNVTLEDVLQEAKSLDKEMYAEVFCPEDLIPIFSTFFTRIEPLPDPLPSFFSRIKKTIITMNRRGMTINVIKLRIFFHDNFRRAEIRKQGGGYHLQKLELDYYQHTFAFSTQYMSDAKSIEFKEKTAHYYFANVSSILDLYE